MSRRASEVPSEPTGEGLPAHGRSREARGPALDAPLVWDRRATRYARLLRTHTVFRHLADELLTHVPRDFDGTLVDLGAGTGELAERALELRPGARVLVVEPAPAMLVLARARLAPRAARIVGFRACRAEEFAERAPAGAVLASAAAHLFDDRRTLSAVARTLRPGGFYAFHLWGHAFDETAAELPPGAGWRPAVERAAAELEIELPKLGDGGAGRPAAGRVEPRSRAGLERDAGAAGLVLELCRIHRIQLSGAFQLDFLGLDPAGLMGLDAASAEALLARAAEDPGPDVSAPVATFVLRRPQPESGASGEVERGAGAAPGVPRDVQRAARRRATPRSGSIVARTLEKGIPELWLTQARI